VTRNIAQIDVIRPAKGKHLAYSRPPETRGYSGIHKGGPAGYVDMGNVAGRGIPGESHCRGAMRAHAGDIVSSGDLLRARSGRGTRRQVGKRRTSDELIGGRRRSCSTAAYDHARLESPGSTCPTNKGVQMRLRVGAFEGSTRLYRGLLPRPRQGYYPRDAGSAETCSVAGLKQAFREGSTMTYVDHSGARVRHGPG